MNSAPRFFGPEAAILGAALLVCTLGGCANGVDDGVGGSGAGSSTSSTTSKGSSSSGAGSAFASYCDARAKLGCPGFQAELCKTQEACALANLKDDVEASLFACLRASCDKDQCFQDTQSIPLSAAGESLEHTCTSWQFSCDLADGRWCDNASYIEDSTLAEIEACIKPSAPDPGMGNCDDTDACLDAISMTKFKSCYAWF